MSEAIAYIAGWQQGSNPIGYAIRAAYLWQNGEYYTYDSEEDPPMCWVLDVKTSVPKGRIPGTAPEAAAEGGFTITPVPGTRAWGVEVYLPEGLAPVNIIGTNGAWDAANRKLSWWGTGNAPVVLGYHVAGQPGAYVLSGEANFDGAPQPPFAVGTVDIAGAREGETADIPVIAGDDGDIPAIPEGPGDDATATAPDGLESAAEEAPCCGGTCEGLFDSLADWLLVGLAFMLLARFNVFHRE